MYIFIIPCGMEKNEKLISLIDQTESMTIPEKRSWIRMLPVMQQEHIDRLIFILEEEKRHLQKLKEEFNSLPTIDDRDEVEMYYASLK